MTEEERKNRTTAPSATPAGERLDMTPSAAVEHRLDLPAVLERVGGDADLLREIAGIFLEEYPALMAEIRSAVAQNDPVRLERAAHSLKGSVANFGAREATAAALALESIGRQNRMAEAPQAVRHLESEFASIEEPLRSVVRGEF